VSAQTRFVLDVRRRLESGELNAEDDPRVLERQAELQAAIDEAEEAAEFARAMERLEEERRRRELMDVWECPVQGGGLNFTDTWGAARSGGRSHKGTDMMSDHGTPTVAPVSGDVEHRSTSLGGLSWYVYGDNGDTFYGTHLQGYENVGVGHVERGTVIGYVGSSGNASADAPHLHFEYHPGGGSPINPYPRLVTACPGAAG
jgi:murein DD-endopeptidase MepM/ murein hydrolase activator NlpD